MVLAVYARAGYPAQDSTPVTHAMEHEIHTMFALLCRYMAGTWHTPTLSNRGSGTALFPRGAVKAARNKGQCKRCEQLVDVVGSGCKYMAHALLHLNTPLPSLPFPALPPFSLFPFPFPHFSPHMHMYMYMHSTAKGLFHLPRHIRYNARCSNH